MKRKLKEKKPQVYEITQALENLIISLINRGYDDEEYYELQDAKEILKRYESHASDYIDDENTWEF